MWLMLHEVAWLSLDTEVNTIDLYGNCTVHHSGTSAAAPEAAGVLALELEANPELTWRDMQHLVVLTSKRNHLYDREGTHNWTINGANLGFNHLFGYGVLDAGDMVRIAKLWKTVPERFHCIAGFFSDRKVVTVGKPIQQELFTESCRDNPESQVRVPRRQIRLLFTWPNSTLYLSDLLERNSKPNKPNGNLA
ncbi:unnamed protein product [Mesocestoides corti]|uniref:Peptidase_S8 domain-containing protein n=1 Tax=Mesocestoides corti TaxID=53468 RepID=A0A0R3UQZ0_MESCO|nr:unnamed protein product [Mesocestoides corti]